MPQTVAVRPNLRRPGVLTFHPVRPSGSVNYSRTLAHSQPDAVVTLRDCRLHVSESRARSVARYGKMPCAAVVGTCADAPEDASWVEVSCSPALGFRLEGEPVAVADFARLHGARLLCVNPR